MCFLTRLPHFLTSLCLITRKKWQERRGRAQPSSARAPEAWMLFFPLGLFPFTMLPAFTFFFGGGGWGFVCLFDWAVFCVCFPCVFSACLLTCRDQELTVGIYITLHHFKHFIFIFWLAESLTEPGVYWLAKLSGWPVSPWDPPFFSSQHWVYKHVLPCPAF